MKGFELIVRFDEQEEGGAEIWVEVTIQGRPYEFLLDTGAGITRVRWDEFTSQLPHAGSYQSSGVLAEIHYDLIRIRDFKLGSIERKDLTVARMAEGSTARDNLVGMDVLKDYCCSFLFDENIVSLEPGPVHRLNDLFLDHRLHPYVTIDCMGTAQATWDTGASLTCVDLGFIESHPKAFEVAGQSAGTDASGNSILSPLFLMEGFSCGGYAFPEHTVVGIDLGFVNARIQHPMTMILGYSTLGKANWVFDFPKRRWGIVEMREE